MHSKLFVIGRLGNVPKSVRMAIEARQVASLEQAAAAVAVSPTNGRWTNRQWGRLRRAFQDCGLAVGIMDGPARLAWCYGDPGVAAALLGAARCVADPSWEREAIAIARRAAQRTPVLAGVRDAGLCHGAAGLGHLFNRIFQATNEPQFGDAARYWFEQTLEMQRPGRGIGGYQAWQLGEGDEPVWVTDSGLLTGSVGIALALLAATAAVEPAWDRMLLTAIPPSNER
jgi:hypothetical protein